MWDKWATLSSLKWLRVVFAALLWLLAFLGVAGVEPFLHVQHAVGWYIWQVLEYGFLVFGVLILLFPVEWLGRRVAGGWRGYPRQNIEARYVKANEADWLFGFCRTFYTRDDHVINRDSLEAFLKANPYTAKVFLRDGQPVGLYIVFSIKRNAVRKLLDGTIESAQQLSAIHSVSSWQKATGLYVTNVSARGFINRGIIMRELRKDLAKYISNYSSIRYVFARMANPDGARIIRKHGFTKIRQSLPDNQIWKYEVCPSLPKELVPDI